MLWVLIRIASRVILMSTHNIAFYKEISKIIRYHQIRTLFRLLSIFPKGNLLADPTVSLSYAVIGGSIVTVVSTTCISPRNNGMPRLFVYFDTITGAYILGSEKNINKITPKVQNFSGAYHPKIQT